MAEAEAGFAAGEEHFGFADSGFFVVFGFLAALAARPRLDVEGVRFSMLEGSELGWAVGSVATGTGCSWPCSCIWAWAWLWLGAWLWVGAGDICRADCGAGSA